MKLKLFFLSICLTSFVINAVAQTGNSCDDPIIAIIGESNLADHTSGNDQWYSYTATIDGKITVSTCGLTTENARVYVYSDCNNGIGGSQSSYAFECTIGTTYLIEWDDSYAPNSTYNWSLTEELAAPGDFCSNPLAAVVGATNKADHTGATDQWYSYTATMNGKITVSSCNLEPEDVDTRVFVYSDCANAIGVNDDACSLQSSYTFECTIGTTYLIEWDDSYAPNSTYNWSLTEEVASQGDFCSNPFVAVVGATNVADHTGGGDQWYSYESPVNGLITLSTINLTTEATYLYVYDDCGGVLIDSKDDSNGTQSEMSFTGEPGVVYLIKWSNEYTNGTYNWSLMQDGVATGITGVKENEMNIYVYPNPTSSQFYIQCEKEVELVNIYNTAGILVNQIKGDVKAHSIELAAGLYILDIKLKEGGLVHKRLVVE